MKSTALLCCLIACAFLGGSDILAHSLRGTTRSSSTTPLGGVSIRIESLHRSVISDSKGDYQLTDLPQGNFVVEYRRIGYKSETRNVRIDGETVVDVVLIESRIQAPTITVTAEPHASEVLETPLSTSVLEGDELHMLRGQSLGETAANLPGVNAFSGGPLVVKPIIRGLMGARVTVAQNGMRQESQSWDEPQAPEIDGMDVERIELVRGPNSVMFGSDALGGVLNVIRSDVFEQSGKKLHGLFELDAYSVNTGAAGGLTLGGGTDRFAYRIHATGRLADDYSTPGGSVPYWRLDTVNKLPVYSRATRQLASGAVFNTGSQEFNASASLGWRQDWGTLVFDYSHYGQKFFIHPEPGRMEMELNIHTGLIDTLPASPLQEVMHEKAMLSLNIPGDAIQFNAQAAFQYDKRREEGVTESEEDEILKEEKGIPAEVQLDLYTISAQVKAKFSGLGTIGVDVSQQRNQTLGVKPIIPAYEALNFGAFVYTEREFGDALRLTAGLRYDSKSLEVHSRTIKDDSGRSVNLNSERSLDFNNLSAHLGLAYSISRNFVLAANLATGWRAPVAAELFTFGRDEGEIQYKVGNDSLQTEKALNAEVSARYSSADLRAELNVFRNHIRDFIYLRQTTRVQAGVFEFDYLQADATFIGAECKVALQLSSALTAEVGGDMVQAEFDADARAVPNIPAARIMGGLDYRLGDVLGMQGLHIGLSPRYTLEQNRSDSLEFATPSYFTLSAVVGAEVNISSLPLRWILRADNLTNTAYTDHVSRYRQLALNPGLNISLKFSVPFNLY